MRSTKNACARVVVWRVDVLGAGVDAAETYRRRAFSHSATGPFIAFVFVIRLRIPSKRRESTRVSTIDVSSIVYRPKYHIRYSNVTLSPLPRQNLPGGARFIRKAIFVWRSNLESSIESRVERRPSPHREASLCLSTSTIYL
jgi:hypothetical protein